MRNGRTIMVSILAVFLLALSVFAYTNDFGQFGTNQKAIAKLGEGESDFWFAVIDSVENRWGSHWFKYYDFDETIAALNEHPEIKFIITTGDNVVNPKNHDEAYSQFVGLWRAMNRYLEAPVIFTAGNHDIGSYGRYEVMKEWENIFGPLDFNFTYGGTHFVLNSNGNHQFAPIEVADPGRYERVCNMIDNNSLVFRHMVKVGYYDVIRYPCELGVAQAVFYGHYGQHEDFTVGGTRYIQTADAKDGHYRLVHIINGSIVEMIEG